jgi:CRISPR-associated endonuclease/helicase Cas3
MIHLSLLGHRERIYQDIGFFPKEFGERGYAPLYAQWRTYDTLVNGGDDIVVNTYATGSGKTKAALLYLHELRRRSLDRANCLFIAPTNELLEQHARDIQAFCDTNALDYRVLRLTREYMDEYADVVAQEAPEMKRRAAKLVEVLKNPRILPDARDGASSAASQQRPYVLVTNPDIFYYALYNGYGRREERALMRQFLDGFDYLVIDEFHYYNPKQLANFLFFLSAWKHFGIFESKAKVCLLSATPNAHVSHYLRGLDLHIAEISPDNEPADANAPSIPSLAPVELDVFSQDEIREPGLVTLVEDHLHELIQWLGTGQLDADQQGVIISSALWRINLLYDRLRQSGIARSRFARLTGVETRQARAEATLYDLILATPTVDLGYNFERAQKLRQTVDFLFFDATFGDEFVQRLGRAGRVLGKPQTNIPSRALAVLPPDLLRALRPLEGHPISRTELRATLAAAIQAGELRERNTLFDYITSGAIEEAFLPILRLRQMAGATGEDDIRVLYEHVRTVFQVSERYSFKKLSAVTKRFSAEREVFRRAPTGKQELVAHLLKQPEDKGVSLWLSSMAQQWDTRPTSGALAKAMALISKPESPQRKPFEDWAHKTQMEYAIREASFSFRESFEEPLARIYDPHHRMSSADTADYGLFHIIQNCEIEALTPAQWAERSGKSPNDGVRAEQIVLYCAIRALREHEQRVYPRFRFHADVERRAWEQDHVCKMTALLGVEVYADTAQLPAAVIDALKSRFVPSFLAPYEDRIGGKLIGLAREQGMRLYNLQVSFATGGQHEYHLLLGTAALLAAAHLRRECAMYHRVQAKDFNDPIWC